MCCMVGVHVITYANIVVCISGSFYVCGGISTGSATVLELSFSSCWKFCVTILGCVDVLIIGCLLGVVFPGINVHVSMLVSLPCRAGVFFMSVHVISSFPCRNCFPRESGVFWIR